jgi:hypothetical protein
MDFDVVRCGPHQLGIVPQETECEVATLTQQGAYAAIDVVMIQVARVWFSAQRASIALLGADLIDPFTRHSVRAEPVCRVVTGVVAGLALATEP